MDDDEYLDWKLNQIKRVIRKSFDPYLGEAMDAIEAILDMSLQDVEDHIINAKHFHLDEKFFR